MRERERALRYATPMATPPCHAIAAATLSMLPPPCLPAHAACQLLPRCRHAVLRYQRHLLRCYVCRQLLPPAGSIFSHFAAPRRHFRQLRQLPARQTFSLMTHAD
jgi:hypothetical protein